MTDQVPEIIYLEPDEEIPSVIARLEETGARKIILVIPKEAILVHSVINLKLLQREAKKLKKEIVVVTTDEVGQNLARKAGFVVFASVNEAREKEDEAVQKSVKKTVFKKTIDIAPPQKTKPSHKSVEAKKLKVAKQPRKGQKRKLSFSRWQKIVLGIGSLLACLAVGGVFYLYLPRATVVLYLKGESQDREFSLTLAQDPRGEEVKAEVLSEEIEKKERGIATGQKEVGAKAKGTITIYNYWDSTPQVLVAQTRFQSVSTGKIFRIQTQITVPGTTISQGQIVPGTIEVEVVADEVGAEYNIAPDKFIIPGLPVAKQAKIYGESKAPMSGGYKKKVKVVAEDDCSALLSKLKQEAQKEFLRKTKRVKGKDLVKRDDFVFAQAQEETCSPGVGAEASVFEARIKMRYSFFAFRKKDLLAKLTQEAEKDLSPAKELSNSSFSKLEFSEKEADFDRHKLRLKVKTNLVLLPRLNLEALKSNLLNRSPTEAENYLVSFEEIERVEIKLFPSFWRKIPPRPAQIKVEIKTET